MIARMDSTPAVRGAMTALVTPLRNGEVDWPRLDALVDRQIDAGIDWLVPCGTTGESVTMTEEENQLVIRTTVELARGDAKVIAGTGSNSTAVTIKRSQAARELGVDAVLTVAPYYNKPTQEGLYAHFRAIAEAVDGLPVVIYNVPGRTGCNIDAATLARLATIPRVIGVKEASGNIQQMVEICRAVPPDFLVLSGDDALTVPLTATLVRSLLPSDCLVATAATVEAALARLEEQEFGVILAELRHSSDDVIGALKLLKQASPRTLSIACSPLRDGRLLIELINQGQVFRFLPKPLGRELLRRALLAALERHAELRSEPQRLRRHVVERPREVSLSGRVLDYLRRIRDQARLRA